MAKETKQAEATEGQIQTEATETTKENKPLFPQEAYKNTKTTDDNEPAEKAKAATEKTTDGTADTDRARKPRKKYASLNKNIIENIIDNNLTDTSTISKEFNISLATARKIRKLLEKSAWQPKTATSAHPAGYFLSKNPEACIQSVMFDRGVVKKYKNEVIKKPLLKKAKKVK